MKWVIILILISNYTNIVAQQHDYKWLLGNGGFSYTPLFNFNILPLQTDSIVRNMPMNRSCVSMCDSAGNLLFYTNSIWINNSLHQTMDYGDSLNPGQVADDFKNWGYNVPEASITIPHPKQVNKYYLFHQSNNYALASINFAEHLYYTVIDMNANGGLGRVEIKNQILLSDSICVGQLEMVKHANGKDWWLIQPIARSNGYYTFLISEDSIFLVKKQYLGYSMDINEGFGQATFSPDGQKYIRYDWSNDLSIYDFNRCTGELSNPIHIPIQDSADILVGFNGGVAVSSNNHYLYVSSATNLYQFDLWATDIAGSKDTVAMYDGFISANSPTYFSYLALAPNGKIYGHADATTYLHTINNPDISGDSCNAQPHGININYFNGHFLPNFPHYRTPALDSLACVDTTHSGVNVVQVDKKANEVRLFPNPVSNELTIELSSIPNTEILVQIVDLTGKVLLQKTIQNSSNFLQIPTTNLSNGMYFVRVHLDNTMIAQPLVVERH